VRRTHEPNPTVRLRVSSNASSSRASAVEQVDVVGIPTADRTNASVWGNKLLGGRSVGRPAVARRVKRDQKTKCFASRARRDPYSLPLPPIHLVVRRAVHDDYVVRGASPRTRFTLICIRRWARVVHYFSAGLLRFVVAVVRFLTPVALLSI
jgi:hypothetical protein